MPNVYVEPRPKGGRRATPLMKSFHLWWEPSVSGSSPPVRIN
jgi:hypothetical protein